MSDLSGRFREVMAGVATPVAVVTSMGDGLPHGTTVSAFASLSMDPPMVLVSLDRGSDLLALVRETGRFGVNVLAAAHEDLARLFASKKPEREKFAGIPHTVHDGIPVIEGALAWVGCRLERLIPGGDHTIGIGAVEAAEAGHGEPLLWFRGGYRT